MHRMCVPIVGRREADFLAPFAPSGRFEQLSIEHLEVFDAEDRFWTQYQVDQRRNGFRRAVGRLRPGFGVSHVGDRARGGRRRPAVAQFFDRLEAGIADRLAAAPEQMQIPLAQLVLMKPENAAAIAHERSR